MRPNRWTIAVCSAAAAIALAPFSSAATCPDIPLIRYESDPLLEQAAQCDLWPARLVRLDADGAGYVRFGGEVRQQYEHTNNPNFGAVPEDPDGVWLQRFAMFGDFRMSDRWRAFAELHSAIEDGRAGGPGPTDENQLEFQNVFVEARVGPATNGDLRLLVGRQELDWGASRLVSARDGPNVRRTFDGLRLRARREHWNVEIVALRPRHDEPGTFDDSTNESQSLWGLYSTRTWSERKGIDIYFLGHENEAPIYNQASAPEDRRTLGMRYFGAYGAWDWEAEPILQWGSYGDGDIRAWGVASEAAFTWQDAAWRPRLALSGNIAAGDRDPLDLDLQTFNPLYPRGNYFSQDATLGPQNFYDAHLFLTLHPTESWTLTVDYDAFWRMSKDDAVYGPDGSVLRADGGSDERFVSTALSFNSEWSLNGRWTLAAAYARVTPRAFIEETGPSSSIAFLGLTARFRF